MPETPDPEGDSPEDGSVGNKNIQQQREHIKRLEKQLKDAQAAIDDAADLRVQLDTFKRASAFDRLNIPATGPGKLFREHYQGELTDEAITAAATEYELIKPAQPNAPTIPGIDQDAFARQMASLQGTQPSAIPQSAQAAIQGATSRDALMAQLRDLGVLDPSQG